MNINQIFLKDVSRPIEGVIKARDVKHFSTEVEEYVLTRDGAKGLELFLDSYVNSPQSQGTWISGFFGSGKSHLLKMMAHLLGDLGDGSMERSEVVSQFKLKTDNQIILALLDKAEQINAKSILFNIPEEANAAEKESAMAVLGVFVRAFDAFCGYSGEHPYLAKFERFLDSRGLYAEFKDAFQTKTGRPWVEARKAGLIEDANVAAVYKQIVGASEDVPESLLKSSREEYSVSPKSFAEDVMVWLKSQEDSKIRINFFVDEVGIFIGEDSERMFALQSIAENLQSQSDGRAWIAVTAQEDVEKVVGDMSAKQADDFSKIMGRFPTRIKLTSVDVVEVIEKRLLDKNPQGINELTAAFSKYSPNFQTMFEFADGGHNYKNYANIDDFCAIYPFVSYQFNMFQSAMEGLSNHNYFEGNFTSVGARSMLAVGQDIAKAIGKEPFETIVSFDQFFEGIRTTLKNENFKDLQIAEQNLEDQFAVRVLKALFLVKFIDGFEATHRNITALMSRTLSEDLSELSIKVKSALNELELQTYILRIGENYEYLTNDEKDIEKEIKATSISNEHISDQIVKFVTGDIVKTTKVKYSKNGDDFDFGWKIDDQVIGIKKNLTVSLHSPFSAKNVEAVILEAAGKAELSLFVADEDRFNTDLVTYLKTKAFIQVKSAKGNSAAQKRILDAKSLANVELQNELRERLKKSLSNCRVFVGSDEVSIGSKDVASRINEAMQTLITRTFPQLSLLSDVLFTEDDIAKYASSRDDGLFDAATVSVLKTAGNDVISYVTLQKSRAANITVSSVVVNYESSPYGWSLPGVLVVIAYLVSSGSLSVVLNGNSLSGNDLAKELKNNNSRGHLTIDLQQQFDAGQVALLKAFATDFFDEVAPGDLPSLTSLIKEKAQIVLQELKTIQSASNYPFISKLEKPVEKLQELLALTPSQLVDASQEIRTDLLAFKSEIIGPIRAFNAGIQKNIFDEAVSLVATQQGNLVYLASSSSADEVSKLLLDAEIYTKTQELKKATEALRKEINAKVQESITSALETLDSRKQNLESTPDFFKASDERKQLALAVFEESKSFVEGQDNIAGIAQYISQFEKVHYIRALDLLTEPGDVQNSGVEIVETVSIRNIGLSHPKPLLTTEADVDEYVESIRVQLNKHIQSNKRISL